jgi:hypothetical protein
MRLTGALRPNTRIVVGAPGRTISVGECALLRGRLIDVPKGPVVDLVSPLSSPHLVEDGPLQIVSEAGEVSKVEDDQSR